MPRLEYLHLVDQTIFEQPIPLNNTLVEELPSVPLPHLTTLQLFGTTYDCTTLLSHITFSSFVDLEIHCHRVETVPQVQTLVDFVKDNFSRSGSIDKSPLSVRMNACTGELSFDVDLVSNAERKRLVSLGMHSEVPGFFEGCFSIVSPIIFDSIPVAATKRLDMRSNISISPDLWAYILNRMTEIRVLKASFNGTIDLSHVLGTRIPDTPWFVAKKLRSLTFSGVSFTHCTSKRSRFHEALLDCLQKRSNGDQRVTNLNFHSYSDVSASLQPQFRKVAHNVGWDQEPEEDMMMVLDDD